MAWFKSRPQAELDGVKVVVLDMSKAFYSSIHQGLGDQAEVIDRFHGPAGGGGTRWGVAVDQNTA